MLSTGRDMPGDQFRGENDGLKADPASPHGRVTAILRTIQDGHASAAEQLLPLVYEELRNLADQLFHQERVGHTLQPTALVHEAYLKLVKQDDVSWQGRAHFYAVAAHAMRRILINHAAKHRATKRGGGRHRVTLCEDTPDPTRTGSSMDVDLFALDEALTRLEAIDERQCRVVEMRYFGGLTIEETAEALDIAPRTVKLDWQMARAWLYLQLQG
jgi:RNA polymerase sigma factor (TIGR02999 family)